MKNHDEFRRIVFEKAEKYEKRRKARNRKIINSVIITSLALAICLPIGGYAYHLNNGSVIEETTQNTTFAKTESTENTTKAFSTTAAMTITTTTVTTIEATYATSTVATTTAATYATSTVATTTEATYATTTRAETTEIETTTAADPSENILDLVASPSLYDDSLIETVSGYQNGTSVYILTSQEQLLKFDRFANYQVDISPLVAYYGEEFFKTKNLVVVETLHQYMDDYKISDAECTLIFRKGTGVSSYLYVFALKSELEIHIDIFP